MYSRGCQIHTRLKEVWVVTNGWHKQCCLYNFNGIYVLCILGRFKLSDIRAMGMLSSQMAVVEWGCNYCVDTTNNTSTFLKLTWRCTVYSSESLTVWYLWTTKGWYTQWQRELILNSDPTSQNCHACLLKWESYCVQLRIYSAAIILRGTWLLNPSETTLLRFRRVHLNPK